MAAAGQQQQSIDLSVLSLEQLNQMKTQHEEDVQALSGNFMQLRDAQVTREQDRCHASYFPTWKHFQITLLASY